MSHECSDLKMHDWPENTVVVMLINYYSYMEQLSYKYWEIIFLLHEIQVHTYFCR